MPEGFLASKLPVFGGKLRQEMVKAQPQIWRGRIDITEALGDLNSCPSCLYQGKMNAENSMGKKVSKIQAELRGLFLLLKVSSLPQICRKH